MNEQMVEDDRLTTLRLKSMRDALSVEETDELAHLLARIESEEVVSLSPAVVRMQEEQTMLRNRLAQLHAENEELAELLARQEQLVAETRSYLAAFARRHEAIKRTYARLTGDILPST